MATHPQELCDSQGRPIKLGKRLGGGAEGEVFEVADNSTQAVKLYFQRPDHEQAAKLAAMVRLGKPELLQYATWPTGPVYERSSGILVGFLMPYIAGCENIHELYTPKSRRDTFPNANWSFLIRAARQTAIAMAQIHGHGFSIGDVNQRNVMVSVKNGRAWFTDCDSYQITDGQRTFACKVGVTEYTPPELLDGWTNVIRTPNHDAFGLAVMIFHILFMGRHPFAGIYPNDATKPIEDAIKEGLFTFSRRASAIGLKRPPYTPDLAVVSGSVADLFERAFTPESGFNGKRPTALEWITALEGLARNLRLCTKNSNHHFTNSLPQCPWCELEQQNGFPIFGPSTVDSSPADEAAIIQAIWKEITALRPPGPPPPLPTRQAITVTPTPALLASKGELEQVEAKMRADMLSQILIYTQRLAAVRAEAKARGEVYERRLAQTHALALSQQQVFEQAWRHARVQEQAYLAQWERSRHSQNERTRRRGLLIGGIVLGSVSFAGYYVIAEALLALIIILLMMKETPPDTDQVIAAGKLKEESAKEADIQRIAAQKVPENEAMLRSREVEAAKVTTEREASIRFEAMQEVNHRKTQQRNVTAQWTANHRVPAEQALAIAQSQWSSLSEEWTLKTKEHQDTFQLWRNECDKAMEKYGETESLRESKVQQLHTEKQQRQLQVFLDRYRIGQASIPGIGWGRTATLQSYGIETAADINRAALWKVPGIGPTLAYNLMQWRDSVARQFRFNAAQAIARSDIAEIDRAIAMRRHPIEQTLQTGLVQLRRISQNAFVTRQNLHARLEHALTALVQAEVDLQLIERMAGP
ncbi:MAG: hypothetical protein NTZ05_22445 [Chloroflexi bacterium]|nr:hypothetical protein [Chloroflexota bacterium]